jgi:hypothetical protein
MRPSCYWTPAVSRSSLELVAPRSIQRATPCAELWRLVTAARYGARESAAFFVDFNCIFCEKSEQISMLHSFGATGHAPAASAMRIATPLPGSRRAVSSDFDQGNANDWRGGATRALFVSKKIHGSNAAIGQVRQQSVHAAAERSGQATNTCRHYVTASSVAAAGT